MLDKHGCGCGTAGRWRENTGLVSSMLEARVGSSTLSNALLISLLELGVVEEKERQFGARMKCRICRFWWPGGQVLQSLPM